MPYPLAFALFALLVVYVVVVVVTSHARPIAALAIPVAALISRGWTHGVVLAYDDGVMVVDAKGQRGALLPDTAVRATWDQVSAHDAFLPQVHVVGRRFELLSSARPLVRALGAHAVGPAPSVASSQEQV
jgi:hypothetical protein